MNDETVDRIEENAEDTVIELGEVSQKTQGLAFGSVIEISILPLRLL